MLKWPTSETSTRSRSGSADVSSRAMCSACRFDCVPPLVNTPSAPGPRPMRAAVQATSRCSISVPPPLWSQVSSEELIGARIVSASSAGIATGQLRCAR